MSVINLDTFASILATYVRQRLADVHRAALLVRSSKDGTVLAAIFGNDDYARNSTARREVELVRQQLRDAGVQEMAFGLSPDGYSWALLVKAENQGLQTKVGQAFRTEMLRAYLDDAVWAAWRAAGGVAADEAGWPLRGARAVTG